MTTFRRTPALAVLAGTVGLLVVAAAPVAAQGGEGFLFKRPSIRLGVRGGYQVARAASDLFDFTRQQLTLDRRDFDAASVGGEIAARLSERADLALTVSFARSRASSEFRDWVDQDDLPIVQETSFLRVPVTVDLRFYPWPRGRRVGRFAWIPRSWTPFVGAGGGMVWYTFTQEGDFVDFETLEIFQDTFRSDGRAPTVHLFGGVEYSLSPTLVVTLEGRYGWARGELDRDFVGFDRVDLSGFQATAGLSARF